MKELKSFILDEPSQAKRDYENLDLFLSSLNAIKYMRFDEHSETYIKNYIRRAENVIHYMQDEAKRAAKFEEAQHMIHLATCGHPRVAAEHLAKAIREEAYEGWLKDLTTFKVEDYTPDFEKEFSDGKKTQEEKTGSEG